MVATLKSDAQLVEQERERGRLARKSGLSRTDCPWSEQSMTAGWWLEGWDGTVLPPARAL